MYVRTYDAAVTSSCRKEEGSYGLRSRPAMVSWMCTTRRAERPAAANASTSTCFVVLDGWMSTLPTKGPAGLPPRPPPTSPGACDVRHRIAELSEGVQTARLGPGGTGHGMGPTNYIHRYMAASCQESVKISRRRHHHRRSDPLLHLLLSLGGSSQDRATGLRTAIGLLILPGPAACGHGRARVGMNEPEPEPVSVPPIQSNHWSGGARPLFLSPCLPCLPSRCEEDRDRIRPGRHGESPRPGDPRQHEPESPVSSPAICVESPRGRRLCVCTIHSTDLAPCLSLFCCARSSSS